MKIALIGATGFVGTPVLAELLRRGHAVTVVARATNRLAPQPGLTVVAGDAFDEHSISKAVQGHDAVVSAFNPGWDQDELYKKILAGSASVVRGVQASGVKRYLAVGGAGSLYVAPGVQLVDTPEFSTHVPAKIVPGAQAARDALTALRDNDTLDWTFLSPPARLAPGERTGQYRIGGEALLMDGDNPAGISVADLAVAIVDEVEQGRHLRARFTVASLALKHEAPLDDGAKP